MLIWLKNTLPLKAETINNFSMKSFLFAGFSAANPTNKSRIGGGFSTSFDSISASLLAFLPLKLLLILLCVSGMNYSQQDVFFTVGAGQSQHYSFDHKSQERSGFTLNPAVSLKIGAFLEWSKYSFVHPYTGIQYAMLGSLDKFGENYHVNPGTSYSFTHNYITIPVGFDIPVYKAFGADLSILNSFQLSNRSSEIIAAESRIWDVAIQPGVYVKILGWKAGFTYYYGLRDVFGVGIKETTDLRFFNRAWHFNVSYKLKTFNKQLKISIISQQIQRIRQVIILRN